MRILNALQKTRLTDAVRGKFALVVPVLEATLASLQANRVRRLGGVGSVTLADLAREFRGGHGDAGICFEMAVHEAIANNDALIVPRVSEVLETFCGITDGASSILFGPEKNRVIPILESVQGALTDDSRIYVGNRGQPPKLKRHIPEIMSAFYSSEKDNRLPRSISGLWKADLFIGSRRSDRWIATTVKINSHAMQGARGLRIGVYPAVTPRERPRRDEDLNLIRLPLPYDGQFMEAFYKSFYLVRAFLHADGRVPPPVNLPDAEDRFITRELEARRGFPIVGVLGALRDMAQEGLTDSRGISEQAASSALSEAGLTGAPAGEDLSQLVSLAPKPQLDG